MIQSVSTSTDYVSALKVSGNQVAKEVDSSPASLANDKTTKAIEVESQANAVNSKDNISGNKVANKAAQDANATQGLSEKALLEEALKAEEAEKALLEEALKAEEAEKAKAKEEDVSKFAEQLSKFNRGFGLSFALEKDIKRTVVTVKDRDTEEVIRQIPSEEFVKLAKRMSENRVDVDDVSKEDLKGILLDSEA